MQALETALPSSGNEGVDCVQNAWRSRRGSKRDRLTAPTGPGWGGKADGGVYALTPPGRLIPMKTKVVMDAVTKAVKSGWRRVHPAE
jgi:hypothetical protein